MDNNLKEVSYKGYERLLIKRKQIKVVKGDIILRNKNHLKFPIIPDKKKIVVSYLGIFETNDLKKTDFVAFCHFGVSQVLKEGDTALIRSETIEGEK